MRNHKSRETLRCASKFWTEELRERLLKNQESRADIERERIVREIVTEGDDAADCFERCSTLDSVGEDEEEKEPVRPIGPQLGQGDR